MTLLFQIFTNAKERGILAIDRNDRKCTSYIIIVVEKDWGRMGKNGDSRGEWGRVEDSRGEWGRVEDSGGEWGRMGESGGEWGRKGESGREWGRMGESGGEWGRKGESGREWGEWIILYLFEDVFSSGVLPLLEVTVGLRVCMVCVGNANVWPHTTYQVRHGFSDIWILRP